MPMKRITVLLAEDHGIEPGARPLRAQFSPSSRKIGVHGNQPSIWFNFARQMLGREARPATPGSGVFPNFKVRTETDRKFL
jgi:hypothetical protein